LEYDAIRDEFLRGVGITVVRYANNLIFENLDGVLEDIREYLRGGRTTPNPSLQGGGQEHISYSHPFKEGQGEVFDFILGNPPFVGKHLQNADQKSDMEKIFAGVNGAGVLDYVCAWYLKAAQYLNSCSPPFKEGLGVVKCAFVSTSSISQGEQVGILWQELYNRYKVKIHFAHRTFSWSNEAKGNAAVHCVIIGFGLQDVENKRIFDYVDIKGEPTERRTKNINPYLTEGNDLIILKRSKPVCNVPEMLKGSQPTDGGNLLLADEDKNQYIQQEPSGQKFIRPFVSADEFLNGKTRWCFWLTDIQPSELKHLPVLLARVSKVKKMRLASTKQATVKWADFPTVFTENRQPNSSYVLIPRVSSENRKYIPMGFFDSNTIASDTCITIPNGDRYIFGVLTSEMHMTWVRYICGRLESRFRYSNTIVYNNYPFPENISDKQKQKVEDAVRLVLAVREKYTSPNPSLQGGGQERESYSLQGEGQEKDSYFLQGGGQEKDSYSLQGGGQERESYFLQGGEKDSYSPPCKEGQGVVGSSLADLYDPLTMPPDLVKAHQALDKAVDLCYRPQPFVNELNRIEYLFSLYEALSAPLLKVEKKKRTKKNPET